MDLVLFAIALGTAVALAGALADVSLGLRKVRSLAGVPPARRGPSVSVVVAARDEARHIERAARSLAALDYEPLEIFIVDDRSTDGTGEILDRLAREHQRLRVVHVTELPAGWLGKNHALATGAAAAQGELILFTDADVVFDPTALGRAVRLMEADGIDHLTAMPRVVARGVALRAFVAAFGVFFTLYTRPWLAGRRRSRAHIGIGAFNLLRAAAYRRIGTHRAIALRPDDDLKLGKLVKAHGLRQAFVSGRELIAVEWYGSVAEMIEGLMKNAFAGVGYSVLLLVAATSGLILLNVWPVAALVVASGAAWWLNAAAVALDAALFWRVTRPAGTPYGYVLLLPAAAVLLAYVMWRSALLALSRGHIVWRGTAYPLAALKGNRV